MTWKRATCLVTFVTLLAARAQAYGPEGHQMVGAIADNRLASKQVAVKLSHLLDGLTLAEAALLPDKIKEWDKKPPEKFPPTLLSDHPSIQKQLIAFFKANPPTNQDPDKTPPNHHWFHYSDVPVTGGGKYGSGKTGRSQFDVVRMIPFCVSVLQGQTAEDNERKITKPVAVILLAHYVGDIHQPLHVGAMYFGEDKKPVNPDQGGPAFGDHGGNNLMLERLEPSHHGHATSTAVLHTYWDDETVTTALDLVRQEIGTARGSGSGTISADDLARFLASQEPASWKPADGLGVEKWSEAWADEILPVAREAHDRLEFTQITLNMQNKTAKGHATEKAGGMPSYHDWSGKVVRQELHKAGWRLAALLEQVVQ
jgi:hypothetical protein